MIMTLISIENQNTNPANYLEKYKTIFRNEDGKEYEFITPSDSFYRIHNMMIACGNTEGEYENPPDNWITKLQYKYNIGKDGYMHFNVSQHEGKKFNVEFEGDRIITATLAEERPEDYDKNKKSWFDEIEDKSKHAEFTCKHCGKPIYPSIDWYHQYNNNGFCDFVELKNTAEPNIDVVIKAKE